MFAESVTRRPLYAGNIIVDSSATTSTIMTTASLSVMPDYPFYFNNIPGGLQLRGTGGVWAFSDLWALSNPNGGDLFSLLVNNTGSSARMAINTSVVMSTGTASLALGSGGLGDSDEATYFLHCFNYLGTDKFNLDIDGDVVSPGDATFNGVITAGDTFIVDDVTINDTGVSVTNGNVSVGNGNIAVSGTGNVTVGSGKIQSVSGQVLASAGPFTDPQVAIIAIASGGMAAQNIGAEEDLHAGISGYAKRSWVAGRGAQHFGHDGSLVITTNGSGTAPYSGYARGSVYADQNGVRYTVLDSVAPYRGSLGNWHNFDATVATSGSLETSNTLNIGATHEGQATILSGNSSVTVSSSVIADTDTVERTYPGSANNGGALWVDTITASTSFVIRSTGAVTTNTLVNWKILH